MGVVVWTHSMHVLFIYQAGELDVLCAVLRWGEHQLIKRMEERGLPFYQHPNFIHFKMFNIIMG